MATIYSNNETININPTDDLVLYKEEFVNSRIEKFLYAICALDFDDLPTPLSRIEELYKCLATGLPAPTFVPQSRVEKYLMAILGAYDASALPVPQSRTEVLLNKILMDDTDLSDIEWLKSRYEFLLAYIAKGGGVSSGSDNDFEYLTFLLESVSMDTLYNTKELPVKSAVLKGDTLVNLTCQDRRITENVSDVNLSEGKLTWSTSAEWKRVYFVVNGKPNTKYIIKYHSMNENVEIYYRLDTTNINSAGAQSIWMSNQIFTSGNTGTFIVSLESGIASSDLWVQDFMIIEYQYGMENWDIPYFKGIGSVKNPVVTTIGKNLFDGVWSPNTWIDINTGNTQVLNSRSSLMNKIPVKGSTSYAYKFTHSSTKDISGRAVYLYDKNGNFLSTTSPYNSSGTFTTTSDTGYINFCVYTTSGEDLTNEDIATFMLQIEEGSVVTEYEPYKSTTVTCNEEVELRRIGDVRDELDLKTGELTQRIGEVVLDGDESWTFSGYSTTTYPAFYTQIKGSENVISYTNFICDGFTNVNIRDNNNIEGAQMNKNDSNNLGANFLIRISDSKLSEKSTVGFIEYLRNNPITLCYTLNTEVRGSTNITTKDQDGDEAELSSFEDITHVMVTSEEILPDVELSVASQFEEDLTTLSLRMNNIATTQEGLEESVDEQTMEVDSTMMATTEIYEQIL